MSRFDSKPIPLITWGNMAPPFKGHIYFQHREHFVFQWDVERYSPVNAWWLSEASLLVYADENFAVPRFNAAGFDEVKFFSGHSTQCYVAANRKFAIIAFRGTECDIDQGPEAMAQFIADLGVDIDIRWVATQGGGKIHRGFHDALDEIWNELLIHLNGLRRSGCTLWLTGHSLGGALATLAAARFKKAHGLYTFGAPRLGNRDFAANFPVMGFRFVNNNDVVPHLPIFPYVDLGELRYIDSNGSIHAHITRWQRWKDEARGHINCVVENVRNLDQGLTASLPDGLKDHTPLLYALHLWNNLNSSGSDD
jgi:triacylglycerol lipase